MEVEMEMEMETEMETETGMVVEAKTGVEPEAKPNDQNVYTAEDEAALEEKSDDLTLVLPSKTTKTTNGDMRRVAEIVLVLSAMAGIRAGRGKEPTEAEMKLMSEARLRLAEVCKELAPKDIVGREAVGALIEDLGLNWKVKDQRLGFRGSSRLSIKERIALAAKKKAEEAKKLAVSSATSPMTQSNLAQVSSSHGITSNVRVMDKSSNLQSTSISSAAPHLLSVSTGRESSVTSFSRTDRAQMKLEPNGTPVSSRSPQLQRPPAAQDHMSRYNASETVTTHMNHSTGAGGQGVKYGQPSSLMSKHSEIAKIVQKVLLPKPPECPSWTPPSRDYMNKSVTCQLCKHLVNEVETLVICDSCEKAFHLKCLEASNQKGIPRAEWHCAKCLSLSNGKPLPPKYGRVMRSLTPQKGSVNPPITNSQRTEGTGQNLGHEKLANAPSVSLSSTATVVNDVMIESQKVNQEKSASEGCCSSQALNESCSVAYHSMSTDLNPSNTITSEANVTAIERIDLEVKPQREANSTCSFPSTAIDKSRCEKDLPMSETIVRTKASSDVEASHSSQDHNAIENIISDQRDVGFSAHYLVESSQKLESETHFQCPNSTTWSIISKEPSAGDVRTVEWVGNALRILDGKTYYQSCCIDGVTYEIYDYALICSRPDRLTPSRLQAMWEDNKSSSKWISVKQCYFPSDLPDSVTCPDIPEINEVYESNHEGSVMADLIQGPCEVMSFTKLQEKKEQEQNPSLLKMESIFVCRWFYDEVNRSFQAVSG